MLVKLHGILGRIVHPSNAALRQSRVTKGQLLFTEQQHPAGGRQIDGAIKSGGTAAHNNHVKSIFHNIHASYPYSSIHTIFTWNSYLYLHFSLSAAAKHRIAGRGS